MPTLSITKTYQDGDILTEADLDNIRESIEGFFNDTGIDSDNVQSGGINAANIGIGDDEYLEFGVGNDGRIGVTSDDLLIRNTTTDKDIIFKGSPSGVETEILRIDSSTSSATVAATVEATDGSIVRMATLKKYVPVGTIQAFAAASAPAGWLLCDGSAVSRTTYADLFALMSEAAGEGDGVTTFNVPDLRGRFLRGWDNGAGNDPDAAARTAINAGGNTGDTLFSLQADENKSHTHDYFKDVSGTGTGNIQPLEGNSNLNSAAGATTSSGGDESRPKNVAVNFIIKT